MNVVTLYGLGIFFILAGMVIIIAAALLLFISNIKGKGKVRGGGAIIIGPFPIIFGTDKESIKTILLLSLSLTILLVIVVVIFHFMLK